MFISIAEDSTGEYIEKKSKFIANIFYVETKKDAEEKIKQMKKKYFDARHNCTCYRILENGIILEKTNDDGEPSGTAGAPILNILKSNNLCNILVVVTRYFGGILLGTGGLVRAYSNATIDGLNNSKQVKMNLGQQFLIKIEYSNFEFFKYYCKINNINLKNIQYNEQIFCEIDIKDENVERFKTDILNKKIELLEYQKIGSKYVVI